MSNEYNFIIQIWNKYDIDHSGKMDKSEFKKFLKDRNKSLRRKKSNLKEKKNIFLK